MIPKPVIIGGFVGWGIAFAVILVDYILHGSNGFPIVLVSALCWGGLFLGIAGGALWHRWRAGGGH